jgi:hypothetical protein
VRSLLALHQSDPSLAAFLSTLPGELRRHPELARSFAPGKDDELARTMGKLVSHAVNSGEIGAGDAQRVAEMFIACLMGLSQYAVFVGDGADAAGAFAELLEGRLFERAVTGPSRAQTKPRTTARRASAKATRATAARR